VLSIGNWGIGADIGDWELEIRKLLIGEIDKVIIRCAAGHCEIKNFEFMKKKFSLLSP
jgi:hypothetical protein